MILSGDNTGKYQKAVTFLTGAVLRYSPPLQLSPFVSIRCARRRAGLSDANQKSLHEMNEREPRVPAENVDLGKFGREPIEHSNAVQLQAVLRASCEILSHSLALLLGARGDAENNRPEQELEAFYLHLIELQRSISEVVKARTSREETLTMQVRQGRDEVQAYLALANHELKEPLRGISQFAQRVHRSAHGRLNDQELAWLDVISNQARRMDALIDGLSRYSLTAERQVSRETVELSRVCADVIRNLQPGIAAAGAQVSVADDFPSLDTDPTAVREVFSRLLDNALRFRGEAPLCVDIGWRSGATPILFVRDNGVGIAPEHHEGIFRLFRQLNHHDEVAAGAGLGLPISRRLVENLGGRLWVESALGQGATFYFTVGP